MSLAGPAMPVEGAPPPGSNLLTFPGPDGDLRGFLYRPAGAGPFPAILWNHGSERLPGWQPDLAAFFVSRGFVFFVPHRAGHGRSPGADVTDPAGLARGGPDGHWGPVRAHERANLDVAAASAWLRQRPFVDPERVAMVGCSFGGIQTLLSAEQGRGVRAFVAFAPAAQSWGDVHLRERLARAVTAAKAPVFILQAANDFSTEPTRVLGPLVERNGGMAKLYPAFGASAQDGHWGFATLRQGTEVWGADVVAFLQRSLGQASQGEHR
jgi:dienelactone hydrolase